MNYLKIFYFFLFFVFFYKIEAKINVALNKKLYYQYNGISKIYHYDTVDKFSRVYVDIYPRKYYLIDLEGWFKIDYVELYVEYYCCDSENITIGLHNSLKPNETFVENQNCGLMEIHSDYSFVSLECSQPLHISRYVSFYIENWRSSIEISKIFIYGTEANPNEFGYIGCYGNLIGNTSSFSSNQQCINFCEEKSSLAAFQDGDCLCVNEVGLSESFSTCILCSQDKKNQNCPTNPLYFVYEVSACYVENGDSPLPCHEKNCSLNKGSCGAHPCVTNNIGGVEVSECECGKGYRKNFRWADCKDVNECLEENTCMNVTSCRNLEGSHRCVCLESGLELFPHQRESHLCFPDSNSNTKKIIGGVVGGFLLLILFLILIFVICFKCHKKKKEQIPQTQVNQAYLENGGEEENEREKKNEYKNNYQIRHYNNVGEDENEYASMEPEYQ